ncbi:uncharacterized protein LOC125502661 [Dendroctonus ponderosae]|uniref:uncharacterized protein LOC125502661 n=1 Tax=Dendroctonus ponderosae TaxID=77166 RepID=UPI002035EBBE|nr:uncharacterized protein LOC125502661 [Dendroctonus ponderosae]
MAHLFWNKGEMLFIRKVQSINHIVFQFESPSVYVDGVCLSQTLIGYCVLYYFGYVMGRTQEFLKNSCLPTASRLTLVTEKILETPKENKTEFFKQTQPGPDTNKLRSLLGLYQINFRTHVERWLELSTSACG